MVSYWIEKFVVAASLLAALPLFYLDKHLHGPRRFSWLVAMCSGLATLLFLSPTTDLAVLLDKITTAAISVSSVPHFVRLIKDSPWFGFSTIPPIIVVIYLSLSTPVDSEAYWRLRAFLHMAVFIIPYLNHLPTETSSVQEIEKKEIVTSIDQVNEDAMTTKVLRPGVPSKGTKTAKHKVSKRKGTIVR